MAAAAATATASKLIEKFATTKLYAHLCAMKHEWTTTDTMLWIATGYFYGKGFMYARRERIMIEAEEERKKKGEQMRQSTEQMRQFIISAGYPEFLIPDRWAHSKRKAS